jgi:hypothetical protein
MWSLPQLLLQSLYLLLCLPGSLLRRVCAVPELPADPICLLPLLQQLPLCLGCLQLRHLLACCLELLVMLDLLRLRLLLHGWLLLLLPGLWDAVSSGGLKLLLSQMLLGLTLSGSLVLLCLLGLVLYLMLRLLLYLMYLLLRLRLHWQDLLLSLLFLLLHLMVCLLLYLLNLLLG